MNDPLPIQPCATSLRLTGFDRVSSLFVGWDGQFDQISNGVYEGQFQVLCGELVRIHDITANQKVRVRGHETSGLIWFYPVTPRFATSLWQGKHLDAGRLAIQGADAEVDLTSARGGGARVLGVHPDALADAMRSLLATDAGELPRTWASCSPIPDSFHRLNTRLLNLIARAVAEPSLLSSPEGRQYEQECIRALASALESGPASQPDLPLPARARIVNRAEEFMRSRLIDVLGVVDLCQEVGASDRTLRLAFQEQYGVGPMTYYRFLRLNAVRSRLQADRDLSITDAAREFGFDHLGNFAADFRRLFGMRPSETNRR